MVAVIDVDAHHGNGTQSIFYSDPGVLTASVHVDPAAGWFPHFLGFESETGDGPARGCNRNLVIEPGTGDGPWLEAVRGLTGWAAGAGARGARRGARSRRGRRRPREPAAGQPRRVPRGRANPW